MLLYCIYWTPYRGIDTKVKISLTLSGLFYWTPYRGIDTDACVPLFQVYTSIEPLIGGLIQGKNGTWIFFFGEEFSIEPLIGGLIRWEIYQPNHLLNPIEPLIGGLRLSLLMRSVLQVEPIEPLIGGLILNTRQDDLVQTTIEPLIGGLILNYHGAPPAFIIYWTPYRGIEMLICFPWEGSGGGVVYGFGVWRVKSWVKNVLNTNKYIAIFSIKWGWSSLTYLPLVVIIFEKSIILFYWTPYRGIDTLYTDTLTCIGYHYWTPYRGIDTDFQTQDCDQYT